MVCKDCHGFEALIKYEYFHNPEKRASSKEPLEPDRFKQFKGLSF
jgi:hypothetical protein